MSSRQTYKRNQVDEALWVTFLEGRKGVIGGEKTFRTRIKRLLEIDRAAQTTPPVFCTAGDTGRGVEATFNAHHAFFLAIALDLVNLGFKQAEVVYVVRHTHVLLRGEFDAAISTPDLERHHVAAEDYPDHPRYTHKTIKMADFRIYLLIDRIELTELFENISRSKNEPVFRKPFVCRGVDALRDAFHDRFFHDRKTVVLEIGTLARRVNDALKDTKPLRRGPG